MKLSQPETWIENKIVQNLFIWFCLYIILVGSIQADNRLLAALYSLLLLAPAVYINNLFILPIFNKKTSAFLVFFTINTFIFSCISVYIISLSLEQSFEWTMLLNFMGIMILALTFGSAVKMARDSFERRQQEREAELRLLKAQLNPHFLFNTLNNLYGLSVVKSDRLPNLMLKLSDLLRYSLYDTKEVLVPLEKEIQYLENYTSLEKIRLEHKTQIEFNVNGDVSSKEIAPMLFIVFVENAFKYLGKIENEATKVIINIDLTDKQLTFQCINTVDSITQQNVNKANSGIGLQNAQKRLDLIYPDRHQLTVTKQQDLFEVDLVIFY